MKSRRYRHVIWDWNGTLFDDADFCVSCMNRLLEPRGLPRLTPERYADLFDIPVVGYYRRLGFDFERESFETLGTAFMDDYESHKLDCRLQPWALELLEAARRAGLSQSVLSAYRQNSLEALLRRLDLHGYFIRMVGATDHYAHGKEEPGRNWIRELGLPTTDVVLVGDTTHDWDVARALGVNCLLLPAGHQSLARLKACGARVLDQPAALLEELL